MPAKQVIIYTDGAARGNPGPGGWAAVLMFNGRRKEISGGYRTTTNNRMELMAAIRALEQLKEPCQVTLFSDSAYLVNAISKGWVQRWQTKGWRRGGKPVPNTDLWRRMLDLCQVHRVAFTWIAGHAGHRENARCDVLAVAAAAGPVLPVDEGYQSSKPTSQVGLLD